MEPFFSDERWESEKAFIEFLEKSNNVEWWFKNGDRDRACFALSYNNGEEKPFYVDFIVKMKNEYIGLFDSKAGITRQIAGPKIDGLHKYIKAESKKKKIFGRIVTNTDRNYQGRWIYFDKTSKDLKESSFSNWKDLEL
jgi:type III restriction enzyme